LFFFTLSLFAKFAFSLIPVLNVDMYKQQIDATSLPFQFAERFLISSQHYERVRPLTSLPHFMDSASIVNLLSEIETLSLLDADQLLASCLIHEDVGKSLVDLLKPTTTTDDVEDDGDFNVNEVSYENTRQRKQLWENYVNREKQKCNKGFSEGGYVGGRSRKDSLKFQFQWMQRQPSEVASAGWSDVFCIGAVMLIYDDALGFVDLILPDLIGKSVLEDYIYIFCMQ
jgi:hypothetical protein